MAAAQVVVRTGAPEDEPSVHRMAAEMATSFVVEQESFRRSYREVLTSVESILLVAETHGSVVGYLLGNTHPAFHADGRVAWVEEIAVTAPSRRGGIGTALMTAFEHRAAEAGARVVALATRRAAGFYRALGYDESATWFRKLL